MSRAPPRAYVIDKLHRAGAQIHLVQLVRASTAPGSSPGCAAFWRVAPWPRRCAPAASRSRCSASDALRLRAPRGPRPASSRRLRAAPDRRAHLPGQRQHLRHPRRPPGGRPGARDLAPRRRVLAELAPAPRRGAPRQPSRGPRGGREPQRGRRPPRASTGLDAQPRGHDRERSGPRAFDPARTSRARPGARLGLADDEIGGGRRRPSVFAGEGTRRLPRGGGPWLRRRPRLTLLVVGDGALRPALEAQAADPGPRRPGRRSRAARADMPRVLSALDLVVLPSHTEGMSNALLEAMAMARPIVATAVGGNRDVLEHGTNALLAPRPRSRGPGGGDRAPPRGRGEGVPPGRAARAKAETDFGLDRMVARYQDLYEELVHA